jgi:predicted transcriptional regulator
MPPATTTSLKLDPEMKERVQKIAADQRRTPHWVMREAISRYVKDAEKRAQFYRDGQAAWEDYQTTGLHLTNDEVNAWFDRLDAGERVALPECHT